MTATIVVADTLYWQARAHLDRNAEQAGFFLADYDRLTRGFTLRTWRAIEADGFEHHSDFHLTLRDDVRASVIKWAWDNASCLVEAHSHDSRWPAIFSPSDVAGLEEWVPRLWWRLREQPYAALVTAGTSIDAIAWIDEPRNPEDVAAIAVNGIEHRPTGESIRRWDALRKERS